MSWGGYRVVQATLNGIHHAIRDLDLDFHWLVSMSGYTCVGVMDRGVGEGGGGGCCLEPDFFRFGGMWDVGRLSVFVQRSTMRIV